MEKSLEAITDAQNIFISKYLLVLFNLNSNISDVLDALRTQLYMVSPTNRVIETISLQVLHKSPLLLRKLPLVTFGKLIIVFTENFSNNTNLDDSVISLPVFPSRTNLKLHNISATPKMVKKVLMNIDLSKELGPDSIPMVVLKNCEPELSNILAEIFNKCLEGSCFPDYWKVSSMVLVFKNVGERSTAENYRHVSLFSVVSKVFEKRKNNRIVYHLEKCGLFLISSMLLGLPDQLQIFSELYLNCYGL